MTRDIIAVHGGPRCVDREPGHPRPGTVFGDRVELLVTPALLVVAEGLVAHVTAQ